jgi:hypothetical protein
MIAQFSNLSSLSMYQFIQNEILTKGQAYITNTSQLYYDNDTRMPSGYVSYASPFKQWVYDSGIAPVPSGVSGSFGVINRGTSGLKFDFDNGRVLMSGVGSDMTISGTYTFKELNFYLANSSEESVIVNEKYYLNARFSGTPTGPIPPYKITTPAIFVNQLNGNNKPFALGGIDESVVNFSLVVMAETMPQLDAVLSICRDTQYKYVPKLDPSDYPINEWGDLKNGTGFAYANLMSTKGGAGNLYRIDRVMTTKLNTNRVDINETLFVGMVDLDLTFIRVPRL